MQVFYRKWKEFCLCAPNEALFPAGAEPCTGPFAPLVFLVARDPATSRGLYAIREPYELDEPETASCLNTCAPGGALPDALAGFVRRNGAGVLNVRFGNAFRVLRAWHAAKPDGLVLTLVGLGDVGGTALLALKLLGHMFKRIQIYDPNAAQCARYEMELNQVLSPDGLPLPEIVVCEEQALFACDLFAFTASRGVPGLDTRVQDVRMAQYDANREMVGSYAQKAREAGFTGLFCQISDPVDHLARSVFLQSSQNADGIYDYAGLLPEQVQGFGLGVMAARCAYYAKQLGLDGSQLRVYGPHGQGLVCANSCTQAYDAAISAALTEKTRTANLCVRELGFKPYLAPALSSAAVSLLQLVRGDAHYGAVPLGGAYFGCRSRMTRLGVRLVREEICPPLLQQLEQTRRTLASFAYECGG